ncbi:unnamed protein product [Adineta steineri]|uniref:Uncharacterized protein n=1 Tax=Adineta steineri TaxID=433720 RepID=A0A819R763_9BILA|nr:unnamed protein product [Adineta steineri]CAF4039879.1 unnamed protein product [Adineta steineri]
MSHFIVEYNSPFQKPPVKQLIPIFEQQYPSDTERAYHSIGLYAVWCVKPFILNRSVEDLIQAKLMGGINDAIHWWTSALYETIDIYISKNFFIGKEQNLMNAIALIHPHRINTMLPFRTSCGNVWFAFGTLLSNQAEKQKLAFSMTCQYQNLSEVIIPFENICNDFRNVIYRTSTVIYRGANIAETDGLHFALKYASCHIYFLEPLLSF